MAQVAKRYATGPRMADSRTPRTIVFWLWIADVKPTNRTAITQAMTSAVSVAVVRMDLFQFENIMAESGTNATSTVEIRP